MTQNIYPQNLKATANLWLWSLRDFVILAVAALLSVLALVQLHIFMPTVAVLCYGFNDPHGRYHRTRLHALRRAVFNIHTAIL